MNRKLYKIDDDIQFQFYKFPFEVFNDPQFRDFLNSAAKLIYMLILERLAFSLQKGWVDNEGRVFVILARQEAMELLGISQKTASKAFQQLINAGLITEKRRGQGLPNLLFVRRLPVLGFNPDESNEGQKHEKSSSNNVIQKTVKAPKRSSSKTHLN